MVGLSTESQLDQHGREGIRLEQNTRGRKMANTAESFEIRGKRTVDTPSNVSVDIFQGRDKLVALFIFHTFRSLVPVTSCVWATMVKPSVQVILLNKRGKRR